MLCIYNSNTRPQFNLAAEEYFLKNFTEEVFMLWRNEPAIIVGKHQNTLAEINIDYVKANNIQVVRRLTGGGAVFHDLGNINFTFIMNVNGDHNNLIDFKKYTLPILEVLQKSGIDARFEGRNDLTIDGKKFSGNAEHVYKNRVLHHGTLLFSSKLPDLSAALNVDPAKFNDKAVKSVRSRVTNISDHLHEPLTVLEFKDRVMLHIMEMYTDSRAYELTAADIDNIDKLAGQRYATWNWNFGQSPEYNLRKVIRTAGGQVEFDLLVGKGKIEKVKIFGDFFGKSDVEDIEEALAGVMHEETAVRTCLQKFNVNDYFNNISVDELIEAIF
ncbi:MAG TPA: lipoate--protein ligase [Bacteroidales bacterium]|nr:MAG: lipoate--protein ligase [Bacteroidetes bacterium GWE2_42_24]OFY26201.1 MAG: lipoate--protein ligase [Bacteroidetes bacterium GWF2_43_11]HBZ67523.1 lipoate--protein ligase [Bacteroidales bacterium]